METTIDNNLMVVELYQLQSCGEAVYRLQAQEGGDCYYDLNVLDTYHNKQEVLLQEVDSFFKKKK